MYETKKEYTIGDIVLWIIREKEAIKVCIYRILYNLFVEYLGKLILEVKTSIRVDIQKC